MKSRKHIFKKQGFITLRETWGFKDERQVGDETELGKVIKILWPSNDKDAVENDGMRFPEVFYEWGEKLERLFEI